MKNKKKSIFALAVAACLSVSLLITAGCGGNKNNDIGGNEDDLDPNSANARHALVLSTGDPDGVFNPFFSTSMVDSNMLSMTQIGMLSTDKKGKIVCGQNEPTVVEDYSINTAKENGEDISTYQFIIKNNIRFSDGEPLTIKDVLFNLYVYLDPAYTGSSTIYSTNIVGLNEYRTQNPNATAGSAAAFESERQQEARMRIDRLIRYVYFVSPNTSDTVRDEYDDGLNAADIKEVEADFDAVSEVFRKELESDWNAVSSSMDSYIRDSAFTHAWQVFLVKNGGENLYKKNPGSQTPVKDDKGNFTFDPTCAETLACIAEMNEYLEEKGVTESSENYEDTIKEWAIGKVFDSKLGTSTQEQNGAHVTDGSYMEEVLTYWATASTVLTNWTAEATTAYFEQNGGKVPNISGITALKGGAFKAGSDSSKTKYSNDYDMLQIKVKGIDPKAIYNFAFMVAPLHYYSADNYVDKDGNRYNCISDFDASKNKFGVVMGDSNFFTKVLNDAQKGGIPVGAGVYRATNAAGDDSPTRTGSRGFWNNNLVYFKRNNYFTSVGSGIENAKIKFLRYQVIPSDQIITSLKTKAIYFGEPNATQDNIKMLDDAGVSHVEVKTNGYGYVGINSRFVPNITVRRAIMKAMDRNSITQNYYQGGLAEVIERPMSKTNWAYPDGASVYVSKKSSFDTVSTIAYSYDETGTVIQDMLDSLLEENGGTYWEENGIYTNGTDKLDYTLTIAGGSTDHPAYSMFLNAAEILNKKCHGIHVKVETSSQALSDLTTGKLQIWAAAWTSTVDPDMYQVYHKDSRAASTLNWGYDAIKRDAELYKYEQSLITDLSTLIDNARKTNDQGARKTIYSSALDMVMELAVELPTYQRQDMFAFRGDVIDANTMQHNVTGEAEETLTPYNGPLSRIWEVDYTQAFKDANYNK